MDETKGASRHNNTTCPACGTLINAATSIDGEDATPTDGDISVCIKCGAWLIFVLLDGVTSLRLLTDDEFLELPFKLKEYLKRASKFIRENMNQ